MTSLPLPTYHQLSPHTRLRRQQKRITSHHHRQKSRTSFQIRTSVSVRSRVCRGPRSSAQCIRQALIINGNADCSTDNQYPAFCHLMFLQRRERLQHSSSLDLFCALLFHFIIERNHVARRKLLVRRGGFGGMEVCCNLSQEVDECEFLNLHISPLGPFSTCLMWMEMRASHSRSWGWCSGSVLGRIVNFDRIPNMFGI